jgi:Co/Zn/Cd efflux system component
VLTDPIGSLDLALNKVPEGVDAAKVQAFLAARPGVTEVHDLHIWRLSTTETALTAHRSNSRIIQRTQQRTGSSE